MNNREYCLRLRCFSSKLLNYESFQIDEIQEFIKNLNMNQEVNHKNEIEWKQLILDELYKEHENSVTNLFEQFKSIETQYNEYEIDVFYASVLRGLKIYP